MNLHPRSIPYRIAEGGLRLVGVLGFAAVASLGGSSRGIDLTQAAALVCLGLVGLTVWETTHVRRYDYAVSGTTVDIRSGVLSRREREIPFERIQNVDIGQNALQRALGIAEVRLETAGGGGTEATLRYVSRSEAARLQELVSRRTDVDTDRDPGATDDILFELDQHELGILGITSANFRLLGVIVVGLSVVAPPVARRLSPGADLLVIVGPGIGLAALIVLWVASGVQAVLRYYGFRLLRHAGELRYHRGLLQQYTGTIPLSKVQTLMIRENLLARALGYATLTIETAGYAPGQNGSSVESAVPVAKRDRVFALARTVEDIDEIAFTRPPKRARQRYAVRYTALVGAVTGALGAAHAATGELSAWYAAAGAVLLVPAAAHLKWVHRGYYVDDDHVVTRTGFWTRRTTIVPYYRVQTVSSSQSVFQRRRSLETLIVDTATSGGFWGGNAVAPDIDASLAEQLRETVHDRFQAAATAHADHTNTNTNTNTSPGPRGQSDAD